MQILVLMKFSENYHKVIVLHFNVSVKDFFEYTAMATPPSTVNLQGTLSFFVRVDTILNVPDFKLYANERREKTKRRNAEALYKRAQEQSVEIGNKLKSYGIETTVSPKGVHVQLIKKGDGPKVKSLDRIATNYVGYNFTDSVYFDSNIEAVAKDKGVYMEGRNYQPYEIVVDKSSVIQGWHEGFKELNEGSKAVLIIPSALGYGSRWAARGKIPPDTPLVFEVEGSKNH